MKVVYTGATKFEGDQRDPYLSIGGKMSGSIIPNDILSNIFGPISKYTLYQTPGIEYRIIGIYNDSASQYTNLRVYAEWEPVSGDTDQYAVIGIGALAASANSCGDVSVEQLPSIYSKPYSNNPIVDTAISATLAHPLPPLGAGMYMGIVLRRTIQQAARDPFTTAELQEIADGTLALPLEEKFNLTFLWD